MVNNISKTQEMQTKKVLIAGAGPAGLSAAIELGKNPNFDVTVLEKKKSPDYKICAGGIEYSFIKKMLSFDIVERNFNAIKFTTSDESIYIRNKQVMLCTVSRKSLHEYLTKKALEAGARVTFNESVKNIEKEEAVTESGKSYRFDYLIGADGSNSIVRKKLKIGTKNIIAAFQYIVNGNYPDLEFIVDLEKFGCSYVWIFPQKNIISVGAGFYPHDSKNFTMRNLQDNFKKWAEGKFNLNGARFEAFSINYDYRGFEFGNTYLAGDAAGLASGLTGEGIKFAILSGQDIAKKIMNPNHKCKQISRILAKKKTSETFREGMKVNPTIGKMALKLFTYSLKKDMGRKIISKIS